MIAQALLCFIQHTYCLVYVASSPDQIGRRRPESSIVRSLFALCCQQFASRIEFSTYNQYLGAEDGRLRRIKLRRFIKGTLDLLPFAVFLVELQISSYEQLCPTQRGAGTSQLTPVYV